MTENQSESLECLVRKYAETARLSSGRVLSSSVRVRHRNMNALRKSKDAADEAELKIGEELHRLRAAIDDKEYGLCDLYDRFKERVYSFAEHENSAYRGFHRRNSEMYRKESGIPDSTVRRFCKEIGERVRTRPVYILGLCSHPLKLDEFLYHKNDFESWFFNRDIRSLVSSRMQKVVAERRRRCIKYQADCIDSLIDTQAPCGESGRTDFHVLRALRLYLVRARRAIRRSWRKDRQTRNTQILIDLVYTCISIVEVCVSQSPDCEMLGPIHALGSKHEEDGRKELEMIKSTEDLRNKLISIFEEIESGKISNTTARVKVATAKAIIDTVKVEIAAAHLGRQFSSVSFAEQRPDSDAVIRRIV